MNIYHIWTPLFETLSTIIYRLLNDDNSHNEVRYISMILRENIFCVTISLLFI